MLKILCGEAKEVLQTLPSNQIQTCITSPPYWMHRDYLAEGQLGQEDTPQEYVARLVGIFEEVKRVLREDGNIWINLGDTFENKNLLGIPWTVVFALKEAGWILRCDIIWNRPNAMPSLASDRPTIAHEYIFLLSKNRNYYYDSEAIKEDWVKTRRHDVDRALSDPEARIKYDTKFGEKGARGLSGYPVGNPYAGRNKRSVWTVPTQSSKDIHMAVYSPKLIEPCVLAGSSDRACPKCGAPWEREVEIASEEPENGEYKSRIKTVGWHPTCKCTENDGSANSIVLDPFAGSGTTGVVAIKNRRSFIGIDINQDYCDITKKRLSEVQGTIF